MMDSQQGHGKGSWAPPSGQIVFDGFMNQIASKMQTPRSAEEKLLSKLRRKHGWKVCELHKRQKKFCPCKIPVEWLERLAGGSAVCSLLSPTAAAGSIERPHSTGPDRQRRDVRTSELRRTQSLESISLAWIDSTQEPISCGNDSHLQPETSLCGPTSEFHLPQDDNHSLRTMTADERHQDSFDAQQVLGTVRPYDNGFFLDLVQQVGALARRVRRIREALTLQQDVPDFGCQDVSDFECSSMTSVSGRSMVNPNISAQISLLGNDDVMWLENNLELETVSASTQSGRAAESFAMARYLSRKGDANILREQLIDMEAEQAQLVEEEQIRARVGLSLNADSRAFLEEFELRRDTLRREIKDVEEDILRLHDALTNEDVSFFSINRCHDNSSEASNQSITEPLSQDSSYATDIEGVTTGAGLWIEPLPLSYGESHQHDFVETSDEYTADGISRWLLHTLPKSIPEIQRHKSTDVLREVRPRYLSIDDGLSRMDTDSNADDKERSLNSNSEVDKHVNEWLLERAECSNFEHFLQEMVTGDFVRGSPKVKPKTVFDLYPERYEYSFTEHHSNTTIMARYRASGMFDSTAGSGRRQRFLDRVHRRLRLIGQEKERKPWQAPASTHFIDMKTTSIGHLPPDQSNPSMAFNMRRLSLSYKPDQRPTDQSTREQQSSQGNADLYKEELALIADMKATGRGPPGRESLPSIEDPPQALASNQDAAAGQEELQGVLAEMGVDVARMGATLPQDGAPQDEPTVQHHDAIRLVTPQLVEMGNTVVHEHMRSSEDPYLFEPGEDVEMELLIVHLGPAIYNREQLAIDHIVKAEDVVDPSANAGHETVNELDAKEKANNGPTEGISASKTQPIATTKAVVDGQNTSVAAKQSFKGGSDASVSRQKADSRAASTTSITHEACQGVVVSYSLIKQSRLLVVLLYLTDACALQEQIRRIVGKSRGRGDITGRLCWGYVWQYLLARLALLSFVLSYILDFLRRGRGKSSVIGFESGQA
jgi:hypothetical protein